MGGLVVVVIGALIQLNLDYSLEERLVARRKRRTRVLVVLICVGAVTTGIGIWQTQVEDREELDRVERAAQGREDQAKKERQAISIDIQDLVKLAREGDPSLTEQEALRTVLSELRILREKSSKFEYELQGLRRYSDMAKHNAFGLAMGAGEGLKENNPIGNALDGAYEMKEGDNGKRFAPRCDAQGINMFANVVRDFPDFPFSHWSLATCFQMAGNPQWRAHAERAKEIFEHTTKIAGHDPNHDEAFQQIKRRLGEQ